MKNTFDQCPKCQASLGENATYCGCGWKKLKPKFDEYQRDELVRCAHDVCGIAAMCKIQTSTGWANLCWQHYDAHFSQQAVDNLDKYGLERQADESRSEHVARMREFVRGGLKSFRMAATEYARSPRGKSE